MKAVARWYSAVLVGVPLLALTACSSTSVSSSACPAPETLLSTPAAAPGDHVHVSGKYLALAATTLAKAAVRPAGRTCRWCSSKPAWCPSLRGPALPANDQRSHSTWSSRRQPLQAAHNGNSD